MNHYAYSDEQQQFRDIVQRFLGAHASSAQVRRDMAREDGFDPHTWQRLCDDLGLPGVHVPETLGGQGFGFVELGIALEEMGRTLLCAPFFSHAVLATLALRHVATQDEQSELLPALVTGERRATLAFLEHAGEFEPTTLATRVDEDGRLLGRKSYVVDGASAELLLVVARDARDGLGLYLVEAASVGVHRRALETIDATRRLAELTFDAAPARRLGGDALPGLVRALDEATIALASEMVGGARALLDSAVEYAKLRLQFGRPIGAFQAIKHKCAEMLLDVELATAAARYAAAAVDANDPEVPLLASHAKAMASDAYMNAAIETLQIHGGIGFTWDHDTHLWFKRARSSQVFLGDADHHRERFIALKEASHD